MKPIRAWRVNIVITDARGKVRHKAETIVEAHWIGQPALEAQALVEKFDDIQPDDKLFVEVQAA